MYINPFAAGIISTITTASLIFNALILISVIKAMRRK